MILQAGDMCIYVLVGLLVRLPFSLMIDDTLLYNCILHAFKVASDCYVSMKCMYSILYLCFTAYISHRNQNTIVHILSGLESDGRI